MNKKILISTTTFAEFDSTPIDLLKKNKFSYIFNPYRRPLRNKEIIDLGRDAIGIIAGTEQLSSDVLQQLPRLQVISRCGSGMDNMDLESTKKLGIKVYNTPDAPVRAVAELTIAVILNLLRKINQMDQDIRDGKWNKKMGNLLYGKKVGIIGFGHIGQIVYKLLSSFGAELAFYDIESKIHSTKCIRKEIKDLLRWADIITLHVAFNKNSKLIIGPRQLRLMKKGSYLINLSRGGVVDENALYNVLKNRHLSGAAIDVFKKEPYTGPLRELDNVILTPHVGSYAKEARINTEIEAIKNLLKGLNKKII